MVGGEYGEYRHLLKKALAMHIIRRPGNHGNTIVTHAIGGDYFACWTKYSSPSWIKYCEKYDLGLIVFNEKITESTRKNLYWQKFLLGEFLKREVPWLTNVCYLDTDVVINPAAPNVFDVYDSEKVALISQEKNTPFNLDLTRRKLAFFRHNYLDHKYPMDSSLFMHYSDIYRYHNLPPQPDYACTGVFLFNINNHAGLFRDWFYLYDGNVQAIDDTEEVFLNYHLQSSGIVQWLEYAWQALWIYEVAEYHSHVYRCKPKDVKGILPSIETSLFNNFFLHFAGSWESFAWRLCDKLFEGLPEQTYLDFAQYKNQKLSGNPVGRIRPSK